MRFVRHTRESGHPWLPAFARTPNFRGLAISVFFAWSGTLLGGLAVAAEELPAFEVVAKEGRLSPERIEVPAGRRIKLIVRNENKGPIEFENLDMRVEKVLAPGATSFVVLPKLKSGEYEFVDEFHQTTGKMKVVAK